jgi:hypothetical protein
MKSRDLPELVKATFGGGPQLRVKTLTPATLLQGKHSAMWSVPTHSRAFDPAHSILRCGSQKYYSKSRIPDPDPCLTGGLGQQ